MIYINGQAVAPVKTSILDHNVRFKVDGADYYIASCLNGGSVSAPPNPEKSGMYFNAWKDGNDNVISFPYVPSGNIDLSASFVNWRSVDYIQSSASENQYIDTGYVPNGNSKFECVFEILALADFKAPFGIRNDATDNIYIWINGSGRFFVGWGNSDTYSGSNGNIALNKKYKFELSAGQVTLTNVTTSEVVKQGTFTAGTINTALTMFLFKDNNLPNTANGAFKMYSFKIYENDTLVKDFVPVATADNVGAMVDTISGTLFLNDGVGDFTYGEV